MALALPQRATAGGRIAPAVAATTFEHDRAPRPEWVAALREVSPLTDLHGTLELVWEPGDPWTPGQRWMLYETVPPELASYELVLALRGPNPREGGHMCTARRVAGQFACYCRVKLEGWRDADGDPSLVSLTQWRLFRRTGRVGRPFWVIQGAHGGHKAFLTEEEKQFLTMAGKPTTMPAIGALPYAEFDAQVLAHVVRFNRLRRMGLELQAYRRRMGKDYRLHRREMELALRKQLVAWLDEQMADTSQGESVNELFLKAAANREMDDHAPRTEIDWEKVGKEAVDQYIETGILPHPSKIR